MSPRWGTSTLTRSPLASDSSSRQGLGLVGGVGQQHLLGHEVLVGVVLVDEGGDQLVVGEFAGEVMGSAAGEPAAPYVERVDGDAIGLPVETEDVLVHRIGGRDGLALQAAIERDELIPQPGGLLELELRRQPPAGGP